MIESNQLELEGAGMLLESKKNELESIKHKRMGWFDDANGIYGIYSRI